MDKKLNCGQCGKEFTATRQQWKSSKKQSGQYCGAVCLGAVRSQRAAAMWANGELKPRKGIPRPISICPVCDAKFTMTTSQWKHRSTRDVYCTPTCTNIIKAMNILTMHEAGIYVWGSPAQRAHVEDLRRNAPSGAAHPSWRGGGSSKEMLEAIRLRQKITELLSTGDNL